MDEPPGSSLPDKFILQKCPVYKVCPQDCRIDPSPQVKSIKGIRIEIALGCYSRERRAIDNPYQEKNVRGQNPES
jgi:hypothetical protein